MIRLKLIKYGYDGISKKLDSPYWSAELEEYTEDVGEEFCALVQTIGYPVILVSEELPADLVATCAIKPAGHIFENRFVWMTTAQFSHSVLFERLSRGLDQSYISDAGGYMVEQGC